jgi:transcriptional regulator
MALKFSRSRHSTSDFDRSLRQQQVIEAIKNKLLSINISQIKELYDVFIQNLTTDISLENVIDLALNY